MTAAVTTRDLSVDPRLRAAIDSNTCWYDALCALHGVRCAIRGGMWVALDPPPPLHSTVKTIEPWVDSTAAMAAFESAGGGSISDAFGSLDLPGMAAFIEASWLFHPGFQRGAAPGGAAHGGAANVAPAGWVTVTEPGALAAWTAEHDTTEVLLPALLDRSSFVVLAKHDSAAVPVAGAVLHLTGGVLSLSNVWAATGHELDWSELVALAGDRFPGRPVTGYEWGEDLDSAKAAGFVEVGVHKVWGPR